MARKTKVKKAKGKCVIRIDCDFKKKKKKDGKGAVLVQKEIITYRLMNERKKMERSIGYKKK